MRDIGVTGRTYFTHPKHESKSDERRLGKSLNLGGNFSSRGTHPFRLEHGAPRWSISAPNANSASDSRERYAHVPVPGAGIAAPSTRPP